MTSAPYLRSDEGLPVRPRATFGEATPEGGEATEHAACGRGGWRGGQQEGDVGAVDDSFIATVLARLRGVEGLGCRAMFGGHALYHGPTLFGIVSAGRVYLKTDDSTLPEYLRRGMKPFYSGGDGGTLGTYYQLPADVIGDPERLREWAHAAAGCAAGATPLPTASTAAPAEG